MREEVRGTGNEAGGPRVHDPRVRDPFQGPVSAPRIFIVAGEVSGDSHAGALVRALKKRCPAATLQGIGGEAMRQAGVTIRFEMEKISVVGFVEVLLHIREIWAAYRTAIRCLKEGVDLLVLVDYPDFNLRLAAVAKRLKIPVVYYISPQIWAWRKGRIQTIAKRVDKMLVVLPFEKAIYDASGIPCDFVGHPLLDASPAPFFREPYLTAKGLNPKAVTLALLPGSRRGEVLAHLPVMLDAISRLRETEPGLQVLIPVATASLKTVIQSLIGPRDFPVRCVEGEIYEVLRACHVAVAASGTVTLQAAMMETPMVIVYRLSWLTYQIAKRLIDLPCIGLVNIIHGSRIVPELVQAEASARLICEEIAHLLSDEAARKKMKLGFKEVMARLGGSGAGDRAAEGVLRTLTEHHLMGEDRAVGAER